MTKKILMEIITLCNDGLTRTNRINLRDKFPIRISVKLNGDLVGEIKVIDNDDMEKLKKPKSVDIFDGLRGLS